VGFPSQLGQVGFRTQASKGVYANPGAAGPNNGTFVRILSGALAGNRELLIPDPEIGGNRDIPDAFLGPIAFSGEYEFYPRTNAVMQFLKAALGAPVSTLVTDHTSHVFTPSDAVSLPWVSIEENIGGSYETFNYTDAVINTFHLEVDAEGYLRGSVGVIALSQTSGNTKTAVPVWDTTPLFVGSNVTVKWNGANLPAKSMSFDVNNNFEDNDFRLGSVFLGDLVPKRREINMGVTIRPDDAALWKTATYGAPAATSAQAGAAFKDDVQIVIESYDLIPAANTEKYRIQIDIPKGTIRPFGINPSGDDVLEHDLEIVALRPVPATPIMTITVLSDQTAVN
jgi:hypothetical protein